MKTETEQKTITISGNKLHTLCLLVAIISIMAAITKLFLVCWWAACIVLAILCIIIGLIIENNAKSQRN